MKKVFTIPNILTALRAPLAIAFLPENTTLRLLVLFFALFTDCIDGYIARRKGIVSQFGAVLDPIMDKFFVFFTLSVLFFEGKIELWQVFLMLARDFFLCLFAIYLSVFRLWNNYRYKSIPWGKVSTFLQFVILIGIAGGYHFPESVFFIFFLTGSLAFLQLFQFRTG